jgi:acetyl-CoA acetyltransferase
MGGHRRNVAVVATAQTAVTQTTLTPVEMIIPVVTEALAKAGLERRDVGFWCHGSCDYATGQPFSFVAAVDALGAWPPIVESHVEMDGAWALYEAWLKIQIGECDTALVFANGKSSTADMHRVLALQLDPYVEAPLFPDQVSLAGLQARVALDTGLISEASMAEVAARSLRSAITNPHALVSGDRTVDALLAAPRTHDPLRDHDVSVMGDGVTAVVLAADDTARSLASRPAWIRALDHRIDAQRVGARALTEVPSARTAAAVIGLDPHRLDVAELHAPFTSQELLLVRALGLDPTTTAINPSGGALVGNVLMAAGLTRLAEVADRIMDGQADRGLGHAMQGPCLQQNLLCLMEGE